MDKFIFCECESCLVYGKAFRFFSRSRRAYWLCPYCLGVANDQKAVNQQKIMV